MKWIKLNRGCEMPEIDESVIWRREDGLFFVREIDKDDNRWWKGDFGENPFGNSPKCTHWARIPGPESKPTGRVNIEYNPDTPEEFHEMMTDAEKDFERLVQQGYPSVQIVVSNHPYSEGIWVEAADKPNKKSKLDHVVKSKL